MEPKRSKYDTNPLDENVAHEAENSWSHIDRGHPGPPTDPMQGGPTRDIGRSANEPAGNDPESEAPTRRIDGQLATSYPSIFIPPKSRPSATYQPPSVANIYQPPPVPPPNVYQPPPVAVTYPMGSEKVAGLGIPQKWAVIFPYLPFSFLGIVASVIELILVPRTEARVRFHAAQGMALQLCISAISLLLSLVGVISSRITGVGLFRFASFAFLIVAMVRVWKGKPFNIPPLDEFRKWLDDKIKPRGH
jgi:uncharacterized membrane protein